MSIISLAWGYLLKIKGVERGSTDLLKEALEYFEEALRSNPNNKIILSTFFLIISFTREGLKNIFFFPRKLCSGFISLGGSRTNKYSIGKNIGRKFQEKSNRSRRWTTTHSPHFRF
jgi:hypothetical protein